MFIITVPALMLFLAPFSQESSLSFIVTFLSCPFPCIRYYLSTVLVSFLPFSFSNMTFLSIRNIHTCQNKTWFDLEYFLYFLSNLSLSFVSFPWQPSPFGNPSLPFHLSTVAYLARLYPPHLLPPP